MNPSRDAMQLELESKYMLKIVGFV